MEVEPNAIYIVLYARHDQKFHWALCIGITTTRVLKLHAANLVGPWAFQEVEETITNSINCCIVYKLGMLDGQTTTVHVREILERIPMAIPKGSKESMFSCRVWAKEAIYKLHNARIVDCSDADKLEETLKAFGAAQLPLTEAGRGYQVIKS
ncbi:hypothetical protein PIIN_05673 [Serendipita indica DSM 11827]|uniref:Uncharacterized protein n=1 Tax=Serendipita indica (strain DSM 11827) TaxID=1109443 RepID=G4TK92_SERID|nr:hypothetical protein PIIN_05673 [Serendipita indica DSM 11827]